MHPPPRCIVFQGSSALGLHSRLGTRMGRTQRTQPPSPSSFGAKQSQSSDGLGGRMERPQIMHLPSMTTSSCGVLQSQSTVSYGHVPSASLSLNGLGGGVPTRFAPPMPVATAPERCRGRGRAKVTAGDALSARPAGGATCPWHLRSTDMCTVHLKHVYACIKHSR